MQRIDEACRLRPLTPFLKRHTYSTRLLVSFDGDAGVPVAFTWITSSNWPGRSFSGGPRLALWWRGPSRTAIPVSAISWPSGTSGPTEAPIRSSWRPAHGWRGPSRIAIPIIISLMAQIKAKMSPERPGVDTQFERLVTLDHNGRRFGSARRNVGKRRRIRRVNRDQAVGKSLAVSLIAVATLPEERDAGMLFLVRRQLNFIFS